MNFLYLSFLLVLLFFVILMYVKGLDYMDNNHKDYKGYDLFDEENDNLKL